MSNLLQVNKQDDGNRRRKSFSNLKDMFRSGKSGKSAVTRHVRSMSDLKVDNQVTFDYDAPKSALPVYTTPVVELIELLGRNPETPQVLTPVIATKVRMMSATGAAKDRCCR
jgi:hypothetical protein